MIHGLDADQWRRAGALFHELVTLPTEERSARLDAMHADPVLRGAVEALLAGDAEAEARLPVPGFGMASSVSLSADPFRLIGQTIGHFRVEGHLASGGMGVVYRARDLQLDRPVALKFLLPFHQLAASATERFLAEARSAGALDHPNLCPVHEVGESPVGPYLAMPWYDGETLKDRLARTGPLTPEDALAIAEQIAAGLQCAHAAGIVHRDIKPGNIMLLPDGTAKILDFGLAKVQTDASHSRELLGTVGYLAPEQIRRGLVDARTDLWALGVMLYEMVGGVRPFTGDHEAATLHAIGHEDPRPLSGLRGDLPPGLELLVLRLLEKDADARYPGARVLIEAIAAVRRGQGDAVVARRRSRFTGKLAITGGTLLIALLAGMYVWLGPGRSLVGSGVIAEHDRLVMADFSIAGLDSTLGPLLTDVMREHLGKSRLVSILPRSRVDSTLQLMRHSGETRLDLALAREVAQREGARAVVQASLAPLGTGYLVTVRLVAAATGDELVLLHEPVAHAETDLPRALRALGESLRRRIGESIREVRADAPPQRLTTTSLEALRLLGGMQGRMQSMRPGEVMATLRAIVALDSAFTYAYFLIGNHLADTYRTSARDSAFTKMYQLRHPLTPMEQSQATASYWAVVGLDRSRAMVAFETMLRRDSLQWRAALNLGNLLIQVRAFERAEALLRRSEPLDSVGERAAPFLVIAMIGQGKFAEADSVLRRNPEVPRADGSDGWSQTRTRQALAMLDFQGATALTDSVITMASTGNERLGTWIPTTRASIARVQGRLAEARRFDLMSDSIRAARFRDMLVVFHPVFQRPVTLASDELWLLGTPDRAIARLDSTFAAHPVSELREIQERLFAVQAVALYAAAGRPARARAILDTIVATSDDLARRAIHPFQYDALGEIALAEGRPREAMAFFRQGDLGADGMPATRCAVCVLPKLARAAEQAGSADSARVFWERYVTEPSLDRTETDQWFLAMAYHRLQALSVAAGGDAKADAYGALAAALWRHADPELRP